MSAHVRLEGFGELLRKLNRPEWAEKPAADMLDSWRLIVQREAVKRAPRWRGHLRRSITGERDRGRGMPRWARVGTNLDYAKPQEFGTGLLSDAPDSSHRRYFPPPAALDAWAIAHGFHAERSATQARRNVGLLGADQQTTAAGTYGVLVSQIIWKRGGTKPRRFLRGGADVGAARLPALLGTMAEAIEQRARGGLSGGAG